MPSIMGLDVGSENPWRLTARIVAELIAVCLYYITCIIGPLWPVGRLVLLRSGPVATATEDITKPDAERMFSWVALFALAGAIFFGIDGWRTGSVSSWLAAILPLFVYLILTAIVFERTWSSWFESMRWGVATAILVAAHLAAPEDDPDDGPTEPIVRATGGAGAITGIVLAVFLLGIALWGICYSVWDFFHTTWPLLTAF